MLIFAQCKGQGDGSVVSLIPKPVLPPLGDKRTVPLSPYDMMKKAIQEVYHDTPQLLDEALKWLKKNWRK